MLRMDKSKIQETKAFSENLFKASTCNAIDREIKRWTSPVINKDPVELEPFYEPLDSSCFFKRDDEVKPLSGKKEKKEKNKNELVRLYFPLSQKTVWQQFQHGLKSLIPLREKISFEIVNIYGDMSVYLYGKKNSSNSLVSSWQLVLPQLTAKKVKHDPFLEIEKHSFEDLQFADVNNPFPYHLSLSHGNDLQYAAINDHFLAISKAREDEIAFYQVLITPAKNDWYGNMHSLVKANDIAKGSSFSKTISSNTKLSSKKALFALKIRLGSISKNTSLFKSLLNPLGKFQCGGNNLSYRTKKDFLRILNEEKTISMFKDRVSYTTASLGDSSEVTAFASLPDAALEGLININFGQLKGFYVPEKLKRPGIPLGINRYAGEENIVYIPSNSKNFSMYEIGSTTSGKSNSIENQFIYHASNNASVIIFDFHNETANSVLTKIPSVVEDKTIILDPSSATHVPRLNFFCTNNEDEIGALAINSVDSFRALFRDYFTDKQAHILLKLITGILILKKNLTTLPQLYKETREGDLFRKEILAKTNNPEIIRFFSGEYRNFPKETYASIDYKVSMFTADDRIRRIFSQFDNAFDLEFIMNNGGILINKFSIGLLGVGCASWMGSMTLAHVQKIAIRRASIPPEERKPCFIFIDEFHRLKNLEICHSLINETRKYKVFLIASHQTTGQISNDDFKSFASLPNIMCFRVNIDDAKLMSKVFNGRVSSDEIMNQGVGEVFARIDNQHIVNFKTFPPKKGDPAIAERIYKRSYENYYKPIEEVLVEEQKCKEKKKREFETF